MSESRKSTRNRMRRQPMSGLMRITSALGLLAIIVAMSATVAAQGIVSTQVGEMPTTGGLRPGPIGLEPDEPPRREGVEPVAIAIERAQVDAEVETIEIVDGVMQDPTGPWVVSWYKETAKLGELGNAVMAGHLDYWDVGPAVFYNIGLMEPGDQIQVTGEDGEQYVYEVDWQENYDAANAPIQDIVGPTDEESLTLITCGGPFDYQTGQYLQRTVVRAHRVTV
ncbi:MAG: class F sortase [Thermomicrobiales bacterium]